VGTVNEDLRNQIKVAVSIQLVSPASGDEEEKEEEEDDEEGFHSISFPSEWGPILGSGGKLTGIGFHSISFPSEWGRYDSCSLALWCLPFPFN